MKTLNVAPKPLRGQLWRAGGRRKSPQRRGRHGHRCQGGAELPQVSERRRFLRRCASSCAAQHGAGQASSPPPLAARRLAFPISWGRVAFVGAGLCCAQGLALRALLLSCWQHPPQHTLARGTGGRRRKRHCGTESVGQRGCRGRRTSLMLASFAPKRAGRVVVGDLGWAWARSLPNVENSPWHRLTTPACSQKHAPKPLQLRALFHIGCCPTSSDGASDLSISLRLRRVSPTIMAMRHSTKGQA